MRSDGMWFKTNKWFVLVAVLVGTGLVMLGMATNMPSRGNGGKLNVVAAENVWGDIAKQLGGDYVEVTSILSDPTADPHLYEANAKDSLAVAKADVVIENGLGYDEFIDKIMKAAPERGRTVITISQTIGLPAGANPHIWYDYDPLEAIANTISGTYSAQDPVHAQAYGKLLQEFKVAVTQLRKERLSLSKYRTQAVAYTEAVPYYLVLALGFTDKTPLAFARALEAGTEPSASDQIAFADLITKKQIAVLLYNPQAESAVSKHLRDLAQQAGVPVVDMSETLPKDQNYQGWQLGQLQALKSAMEGRR
jgi:zinc/manganese transport system substrate-binding protein